MVWDNGALLNGTVGEIGGGRCAMALMMALLCCAGALCKGTTGQVDCPLRQRAMKKIEENRISMFYAVGSVCDSHTAVWAATVPYANAFGELKVNLGLIENDIEVQESGLLGITKDKALKKEAMVAKALEVAQATYALATDTGDTVLQGKVNYSNSDLLLGRDTIVGQRCQGVHTEATTVILALAPYGILPADLTALQTLIDDYVAVVSAPRAALTVRKGATAEIDALVRANTAVGAGAFQWN